MMSAASLSTAAPPAPSAPAPQGAPGADFAAFLATIGLPGTGGEAGGFDSLSAEAPPPFAAVAGAGQDDPADAGEEDTAAPDVAPDATIVEELLAALTPGVTAAAKPPVKAAAAQPAPRDAPLLVPPKPAAAQPLPAALVAEPQQAAGPRDGGAAMTVIFAQAAAEAGAGVAETAKAATVATRTLDLSNDDVWIEQLARDIVAAKSNSGDISFRLMPRHLGRLDVAMRAEEGGVTLRLDTQHEATAKIVTAAQGRLVDDLRQQGVRVAEAEVTCTPDEAGRHARQEQGRASATPHAAHLIETATETEPREEDCPADRRGRFA